MITRNDIINFEKECKRTHKSVTLRISLRSAKVDGVQVVGLNYIRVLENERGKGLATEVMDKLTEWADDNQVTLVLSPGVNEMARLIRFYEKHGFTLSKHEIARIIEKPPYLMIRKCNKMKERREIKYEKV